MSAKSASYQDATFDEVAEACALLLPIAHASINDHGWPPAVARWLVKMHDSSKAASVVEAARVSSAAIKHPEVSTTSGTPPGYGAAPHVSEAKLDPEFVWARQFGTLVAAAVVQQPQKPPAP